MFKKVLSFITLAAMMVFMIFTVSPAEVYADDGTPYNGPHNAPCTIQAEDFNNGGQFIAYYATTSGNQGNSTYRSTDVDIFTDGTNIYIKTSGFKEWFMHFRIQLEGMVQEYGLMR